MLLKAVFFDLDDTLYDRSVPFHLACAEFLPELTKAQAESAFRFCRDRGNEIFEDSQSGRITMEEMYIYRFRRGFADAGITINDSDALRFQALYYGMQDRIMLFPDAPALLDRCRDAGLRIGILTNGKGAHQRRKLSNLGLDAWTDPELVLVSGELGSDKPAPSVYMTAELRAGCVPEELLMVGDSPVTDLATAEERGWRTLLYCKGKDNLSPLDALLK